LIWLSGGLKNLVAVKRKPIFLYEHNEGGSFLQTPIYLKPVEMMPEVMQMLEERQLIIRLAPGRHELPAQPGDTLDRTIYKSDIKYGTHKLISVTVNRTAFAAFGTHEDNEEFLLIGDPNTKPLFLVIALHLEHELNQRIAQGTVCADDFVCLRVRYNDPEVSFFTMLKGVPHGEAIVEAPGKPPTFYVTEPADMGITKTPFGRYELQVAEL
jgi:hypothetical protein